MPETTKHNDRENVCIKLTTFFSVKTKKQRMESPTDNEKHNSEKLPVLRIKLVPEKLSIFQKPILCFNFLSPRHKVDECESPVGC